MVAVTLNAPDDWNDHAKLYDYAFSRVELCELDNDLSGVYLDLIGSDINKVPVICPHSTAVLFDGESKKVRRMILLKSFEYAPIKSGTVVGAVMYYLDDTLICEVPITVGADIECTVKVKHECKSSFVRSFFRFLEVIK